MEWFNWSNGSVLPEYSMPLCFKDSPKTSPSPWTRSILRLLSRTMIVDDRGINPFAGTEKSKWLRMPERRKRCAINNNPHLRKRDVDCDAVFIAVELVTRVYKNYPEAKNTTPWDVYEGILEKKFMHLPPEKADSNHPLWRELPDPYERSDEEWARYFQIIAKSISNSVNRREE